MAALEVKNVLAKFSDDLTVRVELVGVTKNFDHLVNVGLLKSKLKNVRDEAKVQLLLLGVPFFIASITEC
ncbi:MAG: hypothetical protein HEQ10_23160 [Dolichospermum sp. DEX182a]|nr:hypothetical protein [Dolichospermum sp. DEX182a]